MCQNTNELFTDVIKSEKKMFTLLKYIFSKTPFHLQKPFVVLGSAWSFSDLINVFSSC